MCAFSECQFAWVYIIPGEFKFLCKVQATGVQPYGLESPKHGKDTLSFQNYTSVDQRIYTENFRWKLQSFKTTVKIVLQIYGIYGLTSQLQLLSMDILLK